ncbi:MAG: tyrosine-type recombinase/integrase [Lachnospiraceae bacterium]|nr:tyrosine-type recombinase/integrase [Lachnospiraceae bacterium]
MICPKCRKDSDSGFAFCPYCGRKMSPGRARRQKSRGNGTGCAYWDPVHRYWVAQVVDGYRDLPPFDLENPENRKQKIPIKKTKGGFKRREDALAYCATLKDQKSQAPELFLTLQEVFDQWEPFYSPRVDASTMNGYRAAFHYYGSLYTKRITEITAAELQACMDACPRGKRTHQNMKVVAGLLWKYAMDKHIVTQVESANLYTGKGKSIKRDALTDIEVEKFRKAIGSERYAEYIYVLAYLGYRPGELLELRKDQVIEHEGRLFLIEGKKTDAGRGRTMPVHQKIEDIVRARLYVPGTELIFPQYTFSRGKEATFQGFKQMTDNYLRESIFKPMCERLGIAAGKVPYGARHTFSNKLKNAAGTDVEKASLMGHTDYNFTKKAYQSADLDELKAVVDSIK